MIDFNQHINTLMSGYIKAAKASVLSKVAIIFASFAVLWFPGHILDKTQFGLFMIALTYVTMIGILLGGAFLSPILYHASRIEGEGGDRDIGKAMTGRALSWIIFYAGLIMIATVLGADFIENLFGENGLKKWLIYLLPMIMFEPLKRILAIWHRAQQEVQLSITYNEIWPNALKIVFLFAVYLLFPNAEGIAIAMNLSLIIPFIMIFQKEPVMPNIGGKVYTRWDVEYGSKNLAAYALLQQSRGIDLFLVGAMASVGAAADYAVASRLGRFLLIGKQALSQLLAPRLGAFFGQKDQTQAATEFKIIRSVGLAVAVSGAIGVLLLGEWAASLFCTSCYNAYPILLLLSAAFIMDTAFGSAEDYTTMAGYAGWNLVLGIISAVIMVVASFILIPLMGGEGAALAVLGGIVARGAGMIAVIYKLQGLLLVTLS
ncbi:MAG: lipopolysaccharide biosynthesis protein, partial [Bdellovibrionales bacterium]